MTQKINERIKAIRQDAGDNPNSAARRLGLSRPGYIKWENADTENMKLGNLLKFCDVYNQDIAELITGEPASQKSHKACEPVAPYQVTGEARAIMDIHDRMPAHIRGEFRAMLARSYMELCLKYPELDSSELGKIVQFVRN